MFPSLCMKVSVSLSISYAFHLHIMFVSLFYFHHMTFIVWIFLKNIKLF